MKKYLKRILKSLVICSFSFLGIIATFFFSYDIAFASLSLELVWDWEIELRVWEVFSEPWFTAIDDIDGDITANVAVNGSVNSSILGEYYIHYTVENSQSLTDEKTRKITVIDDIKPTIYLYWTGNTEVLIGSQYTDLWAYYVDNYYGTWYLQAIGQVNTSQVSENILSYNFIDPSWNVADVVQRNVYVNTGNTPIMTLLWNNPFYLEYQHEYVEPWFSVFDVEDWEIDPESVFITWSIDIHTLWEYYISYYAFDSLANVQFEQRQVFVADMTVPTITLVGNERIFVERLSEYEDEWAFWTDNYDGTWTIVGSWSVDTSTLWDYEIEYDFMDSSLNEAVKKTRTVSVIDSSNFSLELIGENPLILQQYSSYVESGAIAYDIYENNISQSILIDWEVDTNTLGTYYITYTVVDPFLEASKTLTRTIYVEGEELWRSSNSSNTTMGDSYTYNENTPKLYVLVDESFIVWNSLQTIPIQDEQPLPWSTTQLEQELAIPLESIEEVIDPQQWDILLVENPNKYFDDINDSFAQAYINTLAEQWLLDTQTRLFYPKENITRTEFLSMLFKVHSIDLENFSPNEGVFYDVDVGTEQSKIAYKAYELWITHWYDDGTFRPNDNISRIQAIKYILKLNNEELSDEASQFVDVTVLWMVKYANAAKLLWITDGVETSEGLKFYPENLITREEAAKFLFKSK